MCLGIPMRVVAAGPFEAICERGTERHSIDIRLVERLEPGDWVMTFLGAAREKISADDAAKINDALAALEAALQGTGPVDHFFADLTAREPELPAFLRNQNPGDLS
jgi:hydrogenase expression/formation protein HypC